MLFEPLGACALLIIKRLKEINLQVGVEGVFFWVTRSVRRGGNYLIFDTKEFIVSRDVKFVEEVFPFGCPEDVNIISSENNDHDIHQDFAEIIYEDEDVDLLINDNGYNAQNHMDEVQIDAQANVLEPATAGPE